MRNENINKLLNDIEELTNNSEVRSTAIHYFRENFDNIDKIIRLSNMYDVGSKLGNTAYELISKSAFNDGIKTKDGKPICIGAISLMLTTIRKERGLTKNKAKKSRAVDPVLDKVSVDVVPKNLVPKINNSSSVGSSSVPNPVRSVSSVPYDRSQNPIDLARKFDWSAVNFTSPICIFPDYIQLDAPIEDKSMGQIRAELRDMYSYVDDPNLSPRMNDSELLEKVFKSPFSTHMNFSSLSYIRYDQMVADVLCLLDHTHKGIVVDGIAHHDNNVGTFEINNLNKFLKLIKEAFPTKVKKELR